MPYYSTILLNPVDMPKVFISYARDASFGEELAALTQPQLQAAGYEVFRDVTGLSPGDRWDTKLEFELETSDIVVLIVSEKVRQSKWVHNEVSMAMEIGLPVIPVLSEQIRIPLWLRHLQALDFSESVVWEKLLRAVATQCGDAAEVITPPVQPAAPVETSSTDSLKVIERANSHLKPAWVGKAGRDQYGLYSDLQIKEVRQRFRFIEAGTFWMGSPDSEAERYDWEDRHQVTLSQPFWLADTACTQALWQAVMGNNPAHFKDSPNNPVEWVSWNDAQHFIETFNSQLTDLKAQLPNEAQWEYACRAGTTSPFSFGDMITPEQVNYDGNYPYHDGKKGQYREQTVPVKSLPANQWGLYEMNGNVLEWCQDGFQEHLGTEAATDPLIQEGAGRVFRGGSWNGSGKGARSACRALNSPDSRSYDLGLRLSLVNRAER